MVGKGWFVIYGLLMFLVFYLFIAQNQQNNQIKSLRADIAKLQPTEAATPSTDEIASPDPGFDLSTTEGRDQKRKQDLEKIRAGLIAYQTDKKSYPSDVKQLAPQYIDALPADPLDPKFTYRYRRPTPTTFTLGCVLETKTDPDDKKDGKVDGFYTLTEKST